MLFIESGTIHAIGKDILIAEIQQNSNVTYRVYDYGRVGKDGKKRDLHIEKALAVTNRVSIIKDKSSYPHVADCDYFTVDKLNLDGKVMKKMEDSCDALITTIREKAAPVRIGISMGGTNTRIGLVDIYQKIIACETRTGRNAYRSSPWDYEGRILRRG